MINRTLIIMICCKLTGTIDPLDCASLTVRLGCDAGVAEGEFVLSSITASVPKLVPGEIIAWFVVVAINDLVCDLKVC